METAGTPYIVTGVDPLDPTEIYPATRTAATRPTIGSSQYLCYLKNRVSRYARDGSLSMDDLERIEERALENIKVRRALKKKRARR